MKRISSLAVGWVVLKTLGDWTRAVDDSASSCSYWIKGWMRVSLLV